jgi:integrase/recombinase XerD
MNLTVLHLPTASGAKSPYRLQGEPPDEIAWANHFLDAQRLRQLARTSLRAYAYDLLDFLRWRRGTPQPTPLAQLTESTLLDYVRHQLEADPQPAATTVNHRLGVTRACYCFHQGQTPPSGPAHFERAFTTRPPLGYGRRGRALTHRLRLKQPHRLMMPLSAAEVAQFWQSFRTFRDLAMVGLMLLDGLRSCEVLALELHDLDLTEARLRVLGKGQKPRVLPLPLQVSDVLALYLRQERPPLSASRLFVCLKGPRRGQALTTAGLRSLFRHHRRRSQSPRANPHRFRHTFGADMVRAGICLPALQQLMGHARIQTTLLYVQLAPEDVWRQYSRALQRLSKEGLGTLPQADKP